MFLMTTVFAAVLGLAKLAGLGMTGATLVAFALGGIVLLVAKRDAKRLVMIGFFAGSGALIGSGLTDPPSLSPGVFGAIGGWLLARGLLLILPPNRRW
jgi:hypothetical protein